MVKSPSVLWTLAALENLSQSEYKDCYVASDWLGLSVKFILFCVLKYMVSVNAVLFWLCYIHLHNFKLHSIFLFSYENSKMLNKANPQIVSIRTVAINISKTLEKTVTDLNILITI